MLKRWIRRLPTAQSSNIHPTLSVVWSRCNDPGARLDLGSLAFARIDWLERGEYFDITMPTSQADRGVAHAFGRNPFARLSGRGRTHAFSPRQWPLLTDRSPFGDSASRSRAGSASKIQWLQVALETVGLQPPDEVMMPYILLISRNSGERPLEVIAIFSRNLPAWLRAIALPVPSPARSSDLALTWGMPGSALVIGTGPARPRASVTAGKSAADLGAPNTPASAEKA